MVKRKKKMPEKITTDQISNGFKTLVIVIPLMFSAAGVFISIGQSSEQLKNYKEEIDSLRKDVNDSAKIKEQTAVDIAVMKTEMKNVSATLDKIEKLLTPKRERD